MNKIQNDIVQDFILGKPQIKNPDDHLRIPFKFRKPKSVALGVVVSNEDVDALSSNCALTDLFKVLGLLKLMSLI